MCCNCRQIQWMQIRSFMILQVGSLLKLGWSKTFRDEIREHLLSFLYAWILVINNLSFCVDAYKAWWITVGTCSMNVLTRSYWSWFSKPWITRIDLFGKRDTMCVLLWCPLGSRIKVGARSSSVPSCWFCTVLYLQQFSLWMSYNFCKNLWVNVYLLRVHVFFIFLFFLFYEVFIN